MPAELYESATRLSLETAAGPLDVMALSPEGSGSARFLLLHGNPGSMLDLQPLFAPLRRLGQVAAYDAPGFGRSPSPGGADALRLDALAELAVRMLDHLEWPDAILVGHSHGGGVAQRVASGWRTRVRGLVLLASLGIPAHFWYRFLPFPGVETVLSIAGRLLPRLPRRVGERLVGYFMRGTYAPLALNFEEVQQQHTFLRDHPHVLRNLARVTKGSPCDVLEHGLPEIHAPSVILHGVADQVVPIHHARTLHERMADAGRPSRFVALDDVGHMIASQDPDRCVRAIRELVETIESSDVDVE